MYCINFHRHGSLLFLKCNDLLQRDWGIKPIISNFVELLPKFGYSFFINYCTYVVFVGFFVLLLL